MNQEIFARYADIKKSISKRGPSGRIRRSPSSSNGLRSRQKEGQKDGIAKAEYSDVLVFKGAAAATAA